MEGKVVALLRLNFAGKFSYGIFVCDYIPWSINYRINTGELLGFSIICCNDWVAHSIGKLQEHVALYIAL